MALTPYKKTIDVKYQLIIYSDSSYKHNLLPVQHYLLQVLVHN